VNVYEVTGKPPACQRADLRADHGVQGQDGAVWTGVRGRIEGFLEYVELTALPDEGRIRHQKPG